MVLAAQPNIPMVNPVRVDHPILQSIEPEVADWLLSHSVLEKYRQGTNLAQEGQPADSFVMIDKGSAKVFCCNDEGRQAVVHILRAPAFFGATECLLGLPHQSSIAALETVWAARTPASVFLEAARRSHRLCHSLLQHTSEQLRDSLEWQRVLALQPVLGQLTHVLVTYAQHFGLPVREGTWIRIPLTQADLADTIGVNRRSVNRALNILRNEGHLSQSGRHWIVRDCAELRRFGKTAAQSN